MRPTILTWLCVMIAVSGCVAVGEREISAPPPPLVKMEAEAISPLADDLDIESLAGAVERSLEYFSRLPDDMPVAFGSDRYTVAQVTESLKMFRDIMCADEPSDARWRKIIEEFDFYRAAGVDGNGEVFITGYYAPVLAGSLTPDEVHRYPIYRRPDDHVVIDLGTFDTALRGRRFMARVENGRAVPYHARRDIDIGGCLNGKGFEIAWLADPVDAFFLHIQGSGIIRLPDGAFMTVSYEYSNGHPYRSIGRILVDAGKLTLAETSMQGIRHYLRDHPEDMQDIMASNPSYVFFRIVDDGPRGSLDVPVTGGRSIATDPLLFPRGALAFIQARKPVVGEDGRILSWRPFARFVLNQDAGGAIKGPGRVDLFCGQGDYAETMAGHLREKGALFFLVRKSPAS